MQKEFHEELRLQFQRDREIMESIKQRAMHLMSVVGVIFTAMIGFVGLSFNSYASNFSKTMLLIFLIISLIFMIRTIWYCLSIIKTKKSRNPIVSKELYKKHSTEYELDEKIYDEVTANDGQYYKKMAKLYMESIKDREDKIKHVAKKFNRTVYVFIIGLFIQIIPLVIIYSSKLYR